MKHSHKSFRCAWAAGTLALLASPARGEDAAPKPPAAPAAVEGKATPSPERVDELVRQLGAKYYDEREAAKEALTAMGAPAEPALVKALDHTNDRVRRAACALVGRLKSAAAVPRLIEILQDNDSSLQDAAREAVQQIGAPAYDALRKAQQEKKLPEDVVNAILEGAVQRAVEDKLNACISKDLGWGFYKDQFKDIVALGGPATRVLLKLFTTPEADYAFVYTFDDEPNEARVRYRKQIVQRLAGEALVDVRDPSVVAPLKKFIDSLQVTEPLEESESNDLRGEFYETAAFVLMRLGETAYYDKLRQACLNASGAKTDPAGSLEVKLSDDAAQRQRQFTALSRLAMLQIKADDLSGTERTYRKIIELATALETETDLKVFDEDKDGKLSDDEKKKMEDAVEQGRWGPYFGTLRNAFYNLACAYAQMNKKTEALESLWKAVKAGYQDADWIKRDRDLESIKEEREYKNLILYLERKRQRQEERNP